MVFPQVDQTHLTENSIYNELRIRVYYVAVRVAERFEAAAEGKSGNKQMEVDFVVTGGSAKYCNQSVSVLPTADNFGKKQGEMIWKIHYILLRK